MPDPLEFFVSSYICCYLYFLGSIVQWLGPQRPHKYIDFLGIAVRNGKESENRADGFCSRLGNKFAIVFVDLI